MTPEEVRLIAKGKKINAIKSVMSRTGIVLVAAKKVCDDYEAAMGLSLHKVSCFRCHDTGKIEIACPECSKPVPVRELDRTW